MITIDLNDLCCEVEYNYHPKTLGGSYPDTGESEIIPAFVELTSVKSKGVELITLLSEDQIIRIQDHLLENR